MNVEGVIFKHGPYTTTVTYEFRAHCQQHVFCYVRVQPGRDPAIHYARVRADVRPQDRAWDLELATRELASFVAGDRSEAACGVHLDSPHGKALQFLLAMNKQ